MYGKGDLQIMATNWMIILIVAVILVSLDKGITHTGLTQHHTYKIAGLNIELNIG